MVAGLMTTVNLKKQYEQKRCLEVFTPLQRDTKIQILTGDSQLLLVLLWFGAYIQLV
jgi:hypothetical protein